MKTNSATTSSSSYTPGPHDAELAKLAKQYPEVARDYERGISVEQLAVKYPLLALQYAGHPGLTSLAAKKKYGVKHTDEWDKVVEEQRKMEVMTDTFVFLI